MYILTTIMNDTDFETVEFDDLFSAVPVFVAAVASKKYNFVNLAQKIEDDNDVTIMNYDEDEA